jgi:hypothetical protein
MRCLRDGRERGRKKRWERRWRYLYLGGQALDEMELSLPWH